MQQDVTCLTVSTIVLLLTINFINGTTQKKAQLTGIIRISFKSRMIEYKFKYFRMAVYRSYEIYMITALRIRIARWKSISICWNKW